MQTSALQLKEEAEEAEDGEDAGDGDEDGLKLALKVISAICYIPYTVTCLGTIF